MIRAHLATFPPRRRILRRVVEAILPQVDHLFVVLNEYDAVPRYLAKEPRVTAVIPDRDVKDAGKFWFAPDPDDLVFLIDDDIGYPQDYVASTLARVEGLDLGRHVFGYFALFLIHDIASGRRYWDVRRFTEQHEVVTGATCLGTGTLFARGDCIAPLEAVEDSAGFVDYGYGHWLNSNGILPWALPRAENWLTNDLPKNIWNTSLFKTVNRKNPPEVRRKLAAFAGQWPHANQPFDSYRAVTP